ncbi:protein FAM210B, mitochondrial [Pseudorasbora parva]|uniref:protein FAM210B, mitochondrial n=1 Tax=Pseudorasbora parva TaxID=51549 RepID=UPI00351F1BBB
MFRGNVLGGSLFLRLNFSGSPQLHGTGDARLRHYRAIPCWRVYRSKAAAVSSSRPRSPTRDIPRLGSPSGPVARARMAAFASDATRYSDARNIASTHTDLASLLSVRSSVVMMQTRRSSTTPEKTREERAAQTDHVSAVSSAEGQRSDEKPNKTQQLRKVFKEYGAVGVSFHIGISLISLGIFYLAVSSGLDVAALLCKLGFSESVVQSKLAAGTSTFVLAYAVHKVFAPLRISITLVCVPLIVRHLRRTGLFKPRTSGP